MVNVKLQSVYGIWRAVNRVYRISESEAARSFSAAVIDFPAKYLARAADRNVDAAKSWKTERRCPNLASIINLAREIPQVKEWLFAEIERGNGPEFDGDPQAIDAIVRAAMNGTSREGGGK